MYHSPDCIRKDQIRCTSCCKTYGKDIKWDVNEHYWKCLNGSKEQLGWHKQEFGFADIENMKATEKCKLEWIYYKKAAVETRHNNNLHVLRSKGRKPFGCSECNQRFWYKSDLFILYLFLTCVL